MVMHNKSPDMTPYEIWLDEQLAGHEDPRADRAVELARLAAGVEAGLAAIGPMLEVDPPVSAMARARAAVWAESRRGRARRIAGRAAVAASALAALMAMAVWLWPQAAPTGPIVGPTAMGQSDTTILEDMVAGAQGLETYGELDQAVADARNMELALADGLELQDQIEEVGSAIEALQQELGT